MIARAWRDGAAEVVFRFGPDGVPDGLGVVDWEAASPSAPPLSDLAYWLAVTTAAGDGYADRSGAFDACFRGQGPWHPSCWLHHARNDLGRPSSNRPFVPIAERAAEAFAR